MYNCLQVEANKQKANSMNRLTQNHIEHIQNMVQLGNLTIDQANVEYVKIGRVKLIKNRMPASVRKALNAAVKTGELGHMKKDGLRPEAYFHPHFEHLAISDRNNLEREIKRVSSRVLSPLTRD